MKTQYLKSAIKKLSWAEFFGGWLNFLHYFMNDSCPFQVVHHSLPYSLSSYRDRQQYFVFSYTCTLTPNKYSIQISSYLVRLLNNWNSCQLCWFFVVIHTSCSCLLFVSCWCLIIALHSTKVGDLGALSDGIWTLTVLSLIVTTRSDCPSGIPWFVAVEAAGVADNEKAYGELKFVVFSCLLWDFILCFLPELLGFVIGPFADKGGVGVDFEVVPVFPDPYLQKNKVCW